jgi:hypothetical protein
MPATKQKYVLAQRHQLIDLNKTFKNFKLQFQVVSTDPAKEFHAIVLNQEQLDASDLGTVEMKVAKGRIGGTIVADNDKYQNYFLVLKSIHPQDNIEVEVSTSIDEVEPKAKEEEEYSSPSEEATPSPITPTSAPVQEKSPLQVLLSNPWFWVAIAVIAAGSYYYFYMYKPLLSNTVEAAPSLELPSEGGDLLEEVAATAMAATAPLAAAAVTAEIPLPILKTTPAKKGTVKQQKLYSKLAEIA